jgi:SAM-dependent methyltransferase
VVDLGAGTGVLTAELLATGAEVVAAEPVAGMRRVLAAAHPEARLVGSRAEALPLRDAGVDAVTAAQAFHWFDAEAALAEIHRVLRPAGWLAVLFNIRDLEDPLQADLDELLLPYRADTPSWASREWDDALRTARGFSAPVGHTEAHLHSLDEEGFAARVTSISFVARMDPAERARLLQEVDALFHRHATEGRVAMRYRAELSLLQREGGPAS